MLLLIDGQRIGDTYEVERYLGEGAFAEVYRVRHRFLGRHALKVFKAPGMTPQETEDMLGEAIILSRIGHPNIVRVFNADVLELDTGTHGFFTMEYVPGGSLDRYWRSYKERLMPVPEVVEVMRQVSSGIAVAHAEDPPIVHRDIKPQNILVGYDGAGLRVRISDFGLAKRVNPLTLLATSRGTLGFKPPESFENMDSCAADVWALGTTLYLLLTDALPFPALDERDISDAKRFLRPFRPASLYNIQVDVALDAIVARCLAVNSQDRYSHAGALLADLQRWQPGLAKETVQAQGSTSKGTKDVLGVGSPADRTQADDLVTEALRLAKEPGKLMLAADMLEDAISKHPDLREKYESQLKLWRRGVSM